MKRTSLGALIGTGVFFAAAAAILTTRFYGSMLHIPVTVSATLWLMAVICGADLEGGSSHRGRAWHWPG